jgi:hypothetical protein
VRLAMVLLSEPRLPNADAVLERLHAISPAVATDVTALPTVGAESSTLRVGGLGELFIALMDGPIPSGEAEAHVPFSVSGLGTGWQLSTYSAHAVVALKEQGELATLERLRLFTFLVAAVVEACDAVAVYWGDAHATHEADFFVKVARAHDLLPVMLWTGITMTHADSDRVALLSTAMRQVGLPELMLTAPASDAQHAGSELLDFFFGLLAHYAGVGSAPVAGELVGRTPDERLPIAYLASPLGSAEQVWAVSIPGPSHEPGRT